MSAGLLWVEEHRPSLFDLQGLLRRAPVPFVLLEASLPGEGERSYFFSRPQEEIVWLPGESAASFFRRLDQALARGLWLAGFVTYEAGYLLEPRLKSLFRPPGTTPLAWFGAFRSPKVIPAGRAASYEPPAVELSGFRLGLDRETYRTALGRIKDFIAAGDTYQVNYTFKCHFRFDGEASDLYLALRLKQRVRYGALICTPQFAVVSLSPELFLRREGERLWTSPMKGTAPRGRFLEEDEEVASWLATDPKNRAENVMIVDLLRNDLGRICAPGSVFVRELFKVERYETVFQMISTVEGHCTARALGEIFSALFPCGSVTGAPKLRTMEIIAALEREPRGVYTGALGFFAPGGDFVLNVPIRTVVLREGEGEFGLGSGVVWDSDPDREFEECLLKARFLLEPAPSFSLVETMRFSPTEGIPLLPFHLTRMRCSAAYFGFPFPEAEVRELLFRARRNLSQPAKLRLLLAADGALRLEAHVLEEVRSPVRIGLARREVSARERFLYHKTTHRPWYRPFQERLKEWGLFDVVFYDQEDRLTEGTISNLFLEKGGSLLTPPLDLGLLPGVCRTRLLEEGLCREEAVTLSDLFSADRIYVGNAVRGLLPVSEVVRL